MVVPIRNLEAKDERVGRHQRPPWNKADPKEILVHCRWPELRGDYRVPARTAEIRRARYKRAKRDFDLEAANGIVEELINEQMIDRIVDALIATNRPPLVVVPHPEYDPDEPRDDHTDKITNALPIAFAAYLARELDCEIDNEIIEVARPGRTGLNKFERFLWQPRFQGTVSRDHAYILADDNCSLGGTFAALRSHIVAQGGTVLAVTALSLGNGECVPFPIADKTKDVLLSTYGVAFSTFWREEIGHDEQSLTEGEGSFLWEWAQKSTTVETRSPYFSASEIDSLKQQAKAAKEAALAVRDKRGHKVNPRIVAARKAGAQI